MAMPFWLKLSPCDPNTRKTFRSSFLPMASSSPVASETGTVGSFSLIGTEMDTGSDYMLLSTTETEAAPAEVVTDFECDPNLTKETLAAQLQEMEKVMAHLGLDPKQETGVAASGAKPPSGFVQAASSARRSTLQTLEKETLTIHMDQNTDTFTIEGWESLVPALPSSATKYLRDITHGELRSLLVCKACQGFWKQGRGASRFVQLIGEHRGAKVNPQRGLIQDQLEVDFGPTMFSNQLDKAGGAPSLFPKAHRRIKVQSNEWRYQVAQLDGEWWINKVGTYGMASAQLYWGRMAALLLRLCYMVFPHVDWGFVFVDDFCWLLRTDTATEDTAKLLLFLAAMGCPLSWHKTVLSEVNTWLGFQVNPCGPVVDFPSDKRKTLEALLQTIASGNTFTAKEIERALGRLNCATAAWPLSRPFLQPFWAWKAATTTSGKPGKLIRSFAKLLLQLLHNPQIQPCPYDPASNWWGASDASAHPDDGAYIGGWIADCESPSKEQTWWFHYKIPLEDHPWAHKDGDPTRRIATLEMFGTLILTHFLLTLGGKSLLRARLSLISDNQGNIFALLNQKTKHMPTSAFLMQLIAMIYAAGVQLAPSHMKRDYNKWADELTHPDFTGFRPESTNYRPLEPGGCG